MHVPTRIAALALPLLIALLIGIAGCGSAPPPTRTQAEAIAAVRAAEEVGARNAPQAAVHLALAKEQVELAESLIARGEMERAARVLERARADGELAVALAHEADARASAAETREHIRALREGQL